MKAARAEIELELLEADLAHRQAYEHDGLAAVENSATRLSVEGTQNKIYAEHF